MAAVNDSELRYTFACPSCGSSFSISLERIPPVQARFSCPKCGKPMDFPSRDEARVFLQLQANGGAPTPSAAPPSAAPAPFAPAPAPEPEPPVGASSPEPAPHPPPAPRPTPPPRPLEAPSAPAAPDKTYRVQAKGFENDVFDRRAMRNLIRTFAINESDWVVPGDSVPVKAAEIAELKSLFELRKTARATPLPVCRTHTDVVAHYVCADSTRPLCEGCAPEKKFGGTSLRVCDHCGGTARELHQAPADEA